MKCKLGALCSYVKEKVKTETLDKKNYISTENMLPNKGGITLASSLPSTEYTSKYQAGDILISNIRPYFKKIWKAEYDGGCSNDVLVLRANDDCYIDFLYYALASDSFFDYATATAKGTKMPRGDKTAIMDFEVPYFDFKIQVHIAGILKSLDEKIALNNKINDNLERQAQAMFYKYFVDIDKMPDEWSVGCLLDIADYRNGLAMQKYRPATGEVGLPVLKIKELRQGNCDVTSELCSPNINTDYIVRDGDVVFSWSGSLLVDLWCGGTCGVNQHLFKVTSAKYDKWFYYLWTKYYLDRFVAIAADKATTMGHIKRGELSKAEVLIPSDRDYREMGAILQPMIDLIITNRIENRKLSDLRDGLLPKVMNGEIEFI